MGWKGPSFRYSCGWGAVGIAYVVQSTRVDVDVKALGRFSRVTYCVLDAFAVLFRTCIVQVRR